MSDARRQALDLIRRNIAKHGHHVYTVSGDACPRFSYSIGLSERVGTELVFGGGATFSTAEVHEVINGIADVRRRDPSPDARFTFDGLGTFTLRPADTSWVRELLLGARDYYGREIRAFQIVPDQDHWTIDIPDMRRTWTAQSDPIWRWHHAPWTAAIPADAVAATTLPALRGARITQVARREADRWELLSGEADDVRRGDLRFVPLGTLLGADDTLFAITALSDGAGLRRTTPEAPWERWDPPAGPTAPHTSAFICDCVFRHERKARLVLRDSDSWQLLCEKGAHGKPHLVGLSHLVEADESLLEVVDLPEFWRAQRESPESSWVRRAWTDEERREWEDESQTSDDE